MPPYFHPTAVPYLTRAMRNANRLPGHGMSLRAVKEVEMTFDPWLGRDNFNTLMFFNRITGGRKTNPNAIFKTSVVNNGSPSTIKITFHDDHVWVMDKPDLTHKLMTHAFYEHSDPREPAPEPDEDEDDKKKKKKKKN
eukprot:scpid102020/ scgid33119/ 